MKDRLNLLMAMNPEYAEALARGESWAIKHAESVKGIDDKASRRNPERAHREDGKPRNWCGVCPHKEGCVMCDLSEPSAKTYESMKPLIGKFTD